MTEPVRRSVSTPHPAMESRWSRVRAWLLEHRASILDSPGMVSGAATLTSLRPDRFVVNATLTGTVTVRLRDTKTWSVSQGHA
jgi:hypothetical protein